MSQLNSQPEAQHDEHAALAGHNVAGTSLQQHKKLWQVPTRPRSVEEKHVWVA